MSVDNSCSYGINLKCKQPWIIPDAGKITETRGSGYRNTSVQFMKLEHETVYSNGTFTYTLVKVMGWWYLAKGNEGIITSVIGLSDSAMLTYLKNKEFKQIK